MSVSVESLGSAALELTVRGTVGSEDIDTFTTLAERLIERHGELRLLVNLTGFGAYSPSAFWEDLKFDARHHADISRVALVAEDASRQWLANLAAPFTSADVEHFGEDELDAAREWILGTNG